MNNPLVLSLQEENIFIDNTNVVFKGTRYERAKFKVFYQKLSRTQEYAIIKKHTKQTKKGSVADNPKIAEEKFCMTILNWEGINVGSADASGFFACTEENKKHLCNVYHEFADLIMAAILQDATGIFSDEDDYSSEVEVSLTDPESSLGN
jgi:hypothetical protein